MSKPVPDFEALFQQHYRALCSLAYNLVRDADAAKDIVQDVFLKVWKNKEKFDGDQPDHYLFKATSNTALNYLRNKKKVLRFGAEPSLENILTVSPGTHEIGFTELELKIREAIDRLPPQCKVIYLLSRQEGLSYHQIAETLDLSVKTVENQMSIALQKLRESLKPFLTIGLMVLIVFLLFWLIYR